MPRPDAPSNRPAWPLLLMSLAGIFLGIFWLMLAYLHMLGLAQAAAWWRIEVACLPGAAIVLLSMLSRRAPVPYGTGLILLAGLPWLLPNFPFTGTLRLIFSLPVALVGLALILWARTER